MKKYILEVEDWVMEELHRLKKVEEVSSISKLIQIFVTKHDLNKIMLVLKQEEIMRLKDVIVKMMEKLP